MRWHWTAGIAVAALASAACIPDEVAPPPPASSPAPDASTPVPKDGTGDLSANGLDDAANVDQKQLLATVDSMKTELRDKPRDFGVNVALGNLYYDNNRFIDAIEYYTDGLKLAAETEKQLNDLTASKSFDPKAPVPASCRLMEPTAKEAKDGPHLRALENVVAGAKALAETDPKGSVACLGQLLPMISNVHARRGNSWYLIGNADRAQGDHAAALALDPDNAEALFFSGALVLETAKGDAVKLAQGKAYWEKLLKVAPNHPRADLVRKTLPRIDQLFGPNANAGHPPTGDGQPGEDEEPAAAPQLPAGMMQAMQNVQHTPEMDAQLDKTTEEGEALLQKQQWQEALDTFKRVMPLRPSGRIALDLGIALRELGKPTAERVLTQATRMPGGDPQRARYELAVFYEKKDPQQAKTIYADLVNDPKVGADAKARLARLP